MKDTNSYISPEMDIWECESQTPIASSLFGDQISPYQLQEWEEE